MGFNEMMKRYKAVLFSAFYLALTGAFVGAFAVTHSNESHAQSLDGQMVNFNAWGGSPAINDYISWVGERLKAEHGIALNHVKLSDTGSAVSRILAEKTVGRLDDGSVDLIWVNGENFASMKRNGLLQPQSWATDLPSWRYTDAKALPGLVVDFGNPTDGLESPWGRAQLVFAHDSATLPVPPKSVKALGEWIGDNPGRFTYPQPPDFTGVSFMKQVMIELADDRSVFAKPASDVDTEKALAPLWAWLADVHPNLWQGGKNFPKNYTDLARLLGDGDIAIAMAFNPAEFSNGIKAEILPDSVRSYVHEQGTLANVHYVAIPFNTSSFEAAKITADFLLSPEAQIRKANSDIWGDPTVLSIAKLSAADQAAFNALPRGIATLTEAELGQTLPEPHPSWVAVLEDGWAKRYLGGN